ALVARLFQLAFFQLLLALNAVARPGHSFKPLGIDLIAAAYAFAKRAFADTLQRRLDHLQQLAVIVALREEKLLGVGTSRAIGNVLGRILVGDPTILFRAANCLAEALLPLFQPLFE